MASRADSTNDFSTKSTYRKGSNMDEKGNLWQSILNEVALRDDIKESHLIVLGDRSAGKRTLIQAINKNNSKSVLRRFND
jgi:hypothetical protein